MTLRCYFDGSRSGDGRWLTLAAVATGDEIGKSLEQRWGAVLEKHGAPYVHMRELTGLSDGFRTWSTYQRWELMEDLIEVLRMYASHPHVRRFASCVDLEAHALRAKTDPALPSPERFCVVIIMRNIYKWYCDPAGPFREPILGPMEFYFDRGEPFRGHVEEDWRSGRSLQEFPELGLISKIEQADMKTCPLLQVADMAAWARCRAQAHVGHDISGMDHTAYRIAGSTLIETWEVVNETALQKGSFPEHGEGRRRLLRKGRPRRQRRAADLPAATGEREPPKP